MNRLLPAAELLDAARAPRSRSSPPGPTIAHAATKAIVRAQADHGTHGADARTAELTSHLFETEDSRNAVRSFLTRRTGQGHIFGVMTYRYIRA